ncbi:unnamed protein product [Phyllotreta striolata]|uniref:Uncharacterized protein n=1 Tax=Phyllotreta striolata TaxID=444603 RepID=A0A9P0DFA9_PHYSR|nr:unnamed protein product [Phyllotreta striolata]
MSNSYKYQQNTSLIMVRCTRIIAIYHISVVLISWLMVTSAQEYTFVNPVRFPYSPTGSPYVGTFVAVAMPIDITGPADLFFSFNIEASYGLPENQTEFQYPPLITSTRRFLYNLLESKINEYGYQGKDCLQRAICEAAEYTTLNSGVLGDIVHIILTPSASLKEKNIDDYIESEEFGKKNGHCKKYKKNCPLSILNLVSKVKNYI